MPKIETPIQKLKAMAPKNPHKKLTEPLWKGPSVDGVTFSLLSRYLTCKERFRVTTMEGWKPPEGFSVPLEFGNMWHVCEEHFAVGGGRVWANKLLEYTQKLFAKFPMNRELIQHWHKVCLTEFPQYLEYWSKHPSQKNKTFILSEEVFCEPITLPSGRVVYLKGKKDSGHAIKGRRWLQENKTKGDVEGLRIQRQLKYDLQTMLYLVSWESELKRKGGPISKLKLGGVLYNVVRRPLAGGKYSIRKHAPSKKNPAGESDAEFYERLEEIIKADRGHFFFRWEIEVTDRDVEEFKIKCLYPILENLLDDYEWWELCGKEKDEVSLWDNSIRQEVFPKHLPRHYIHPFGVRNVLDEGGATDLDDYILAGSTVGLERVSTLFPELEEA